MKNQPKTVIDTLHERLREQAKRFNPSLESVPVAVLWTDERRDWEGVLSQLKRERLRQWLNRDGGQL